MIKANFFVPNILTKSMGNFEQKVNVVPIALNVVAVERHRIQFFDVWRQCAHGSDFLPVHAIMEKFGMFFQVSCCLIKCVVGGIVPSLCGQTDQEASFVRERRLECFAVDFLQ